MWVIFGNILTKKSKLRHSICVSLFSDMQLWWYESWKLWLLNCTFNVLIHIWKCGPQHLHWPYVVVDWVTFLDIHDSNFCPKDSYPDWGFMWFPWSLQANSRTVHQIMPQSLHFIPFTNHWSLIILAFDATQSQLLTASLNHQ